MPFQDSQQIQSSTKSNSRKTLSNLYFLYFSAVYLFIFLLMQSSVRNTGKFKPFQFVVGHNFTTSSTIKISEYLPGSKLRSVQWRRKYEGLIQKMYHLDALCEYSCSQLDKDFTVEATIESELVGQNRIQTKINVYGPVNLQPEYSFLAEDIPYTNEDFEIDIIGNRKIYSCFISFISGQIYLKNKVMMSISPFMIPVSDLINCFVQKANGVDVVICPNFYLKVAMLKTFNEIMDNYTENFEPVMIKISDPRDFNPTIRLNAKWKRFLLRLNYLKQDSSRRMSMPQIMSTVVRVPPNQNEMKKISERYSEDTASVQLIENKIKPEIMKKSQTFERTNNKNERKGNFLQNQAQLVDSEIQGEVGAQAAGEQLFAEIQGVLYDENEPEQEVIELNDSFQQFENKSRSEKQMKKWQMVKANKKQREVQNTRRKQLQKTLQQLQNKHEQLMSTNQKLKEELQTQKNQNYSVMINTQRLRLANLRREYEKLLEETNKKYEEMNRIQNNMERSGKL